MDSLELTKDAAAKWVARRGDERWSAADEDQLSQWLNASTGNLIAFLRMEAAWKDADRLKVLGAGFEPGAVPTLEDFRASPFFRHVAKDNAAPPRMNRVLDAGRFGWFAAAASVLFVAALGFWGWMSLDSATAYSTPIGVTSAVPLADGSKITLNTDSKIRVALTAQERKVELKQGEAFFEVMQDPRRPFTVIAADKRIVVLGTKFSVRRDHEVVRVIVTEGKVRIEPADAGAPAGSTQLSAGNVALAGNGRLNEQKRTVAEAEELLSWRTGYVVFHETSLGEAVNEFNRYNTVKFVIEDPAVAKIGISGNFRSTNVESFARLLEDGFPVAVDRRGDRIVLTRP